jgi:hypothetical protein
VSGSIRLWDVATGKELPQSGELITAIALPADGTFLATGCRDGAVRLWDPRTGKLLRELKGHAQRVEVVAVAGTLVAAGAHLGASGQIHVWDRTADEPLRKTIRAPRGHEYLELAPDGKVISSEGARGVVSFWNTSSGEELPGTDYGWYGQRSSAFSPDGRLVATVHHGPWNGVRLWDVAAGREVRRFDRLSMTPTTVAFSPDGRTLAVGDAAGGPVRLVDTATGQVRGRLLGQDSAERALAFTSNGRALAWSDLSSVHVTEVATNKELRHFVVHERARHPIEMAVTGNGSLLVARGDDSVATVWSLAGLEKDMRPRTTTRRGEELEGLWKDLCGEDAEKAYAAVWSLAESPGQAVALLRKRVPAASPPSARDRELFARLLAGLDEEEFARREKAQDDLARMGRVVEGLVRAELKKGPASAEVSRRLTQVLDRLAKAEPTAEDLRGLRAVEVLEQAATAEARQALAALARGLPEARLTQEAKAAEARLAKRLEK